MTNTLVVYHENCLDGIGSCYLAYKHFGNRASYVAANHVHKIKLSTFKDKHVVFVDFSYKYEYLKQICEVACAVDIFDHHFYIKNDIERLQQELQEQEHTQDLLHYYYEEDLSGIGVVHKHLLKEDKPLPKILQHIQDRDLWTFSLENTREICSYLKTLDHSLGNLRKVIEEEHYEEVLMKGRGLRERELHTLAQIVNTAEIKNVAGYDVPVITNCPKEYVSEACNILLGKAPIHKRFPNTPAGTWAFSANRGKTPRGWIWSLRSNETGIDVGKLCKVLGGGGHRNAAGYEELVHDV